LRPDIHAIVTCVLYEKNQKEKDALFNYFNKTKGIDFVYFYALRNRAGTPLDWQLENQHYDLSPLAQRGRKLLPCKYLWEDLFIYWNGDVGVCCEDSAARRIVIGNLERQSLLEIWVGEEMTAIRQAHIQRKRKSLRVCGQSCTYNTIWLKPKT